MKDLHDCRAEIDEIDAQLVSLFERRMAASRDIALYKQAHRMDILNASREQAVLASRSAQVKDPSLGESVTALFREIMRLSREEQRRFLSAQAGAARRIQRCARRVQRERRGWFFRGTLRPHQPADI